MNLVPSSFNIIRISNREYISTKKLHTEIGSPFTELKSFNRHIREMETYTELVSQKHILEIQWGEAKESSIEDLKNLIKENSYRPVVLVDRVAQKAIEHHFESTADRAVFSAKESAALETYGIESDMILGDPQMVAILRAYTMAQKAKDKVDRVELDTQEIKNSLKTVESKVDDMKVGVRRFIGIAKETHKQVSDIKSNVGVGNYGMLQVFDRNREYIYPEGYIGLKQIRKKYFKGIRLANIRMFLDHKKHDSKTCRVLETGKEICELPVFKERGLRERFKELIKESRLCNETDNNFIYFHESLSRFFVSKGG